MYRKDNFDNILEDLIDSGNITWEWYRTLDKVKTIFLTTRGMGNRDKLFPEFKK